MKLRVDALAMVFDRAVCDAQLRGDLLRIQPLYQQGGNLLLAWAQQLGAKAC